MAKKNESHIPSCPWRRPAMKTPAKPHRAKQRALSARENFRWIRGYQPSGAAEVTAAGKPVREVTFKVA